MANDISNITKGMKKLLREHPLGEERNSLLERIDFVNKRLEDLEKRGVIKKFEPKGIPTDKFQKVFWDGKEIGIDGKVIE